MNLLPTRNPLPENVRSRVVEVLQPCLAATVDMYLQAKTAHWNVRGPRFFPLHELFDSVAEALLEPMDDLAERIGQLGGIVEGGSSQTVPKRTFLKEISVSETAEDYFLRQVADALSTLSAHYGKGIDETGKAGDADTADLLTEVSRIVEKQLWFVESHLTGR